MNTIPNNSCPHCGNAAGHRPERCPEVGAVKYDQLGQIVEVTYIRAIVAAARAQQETASQMVNVGPGFQA